MQAAVYRKLNQLVDTYRTERHANPDVYVRHLFESLDWGNRSTFSIDKDGDYGYRLLADRFPVINILTASPNNVDRVYSALNRAYNQDVPWVVATDFNSLGLYGSYWVSFPHDVSSALALKIDYSDYLLEADHLELLTPHAVVNNRLQEVYETFTGRKRRIPIDLLLVARMSQWRRLALDALGVSDSDADTLIHKLINSLFLIRYIEDAKKTPVLHRLAEVAELPTQTEFEVELRAMFSALTMQTGYQTPSASELADLNSTPLRTLIRQLYGFSEWGVEYDFAAMNVDVLGRFYEEYLRLKVDPSPAQRLTVSPSLFGTEAYEMTDIRHKQGVYFTPPYIVNHIVAILIDRYRAANKNDLVPYILDMSAGSGTFISTAVDHVLKAYPNAYKQPSQVINSLIGFDVDARATDAARMHLTAKLIGHGLIDDDLNKPRITLKFHEVDVLLMGPESRGIQELLPNEGVDLIIGNPPYIKYESLIEKYDLETFQANFDTATGRFDSYILFLEAALKLLKAGGFGGLVLPTALLRAQAAATLRAWFADKADILEFVDFLDQPVFQGVGAYVCILLFRKRPQGTVKPKVLVAKIFQLSETPAAQLARISVLSQEPVEGCEVFTTDQPAGRSSWQFKNASETKILGLMQQSSDEKVQDVLEAFQGIKTGADSVFIVQATKIDKNMSIMPGKVPNIIENDMLVPVFRNKDMKRWGAQPNMFVIYPYSRLSKQLIEWEILEQKYPATTAYLSANKRELSRRKSLKKEDWYQLIRPRTQTVYADTPRLFIAELSLKPIVCRPIVNDAAIVGGAGGGSFLLHKDSRYDIMAVMAFLNSSLAEWYLKQFASLLRGGYILVEQKTLSPLPLPRFLKDPENFAASELKRLGLLLYNIISQTPGALDTKVRREVAATEDAIDSIILGEMGYTTSQAEAIRGRIDGSSKRG